LSSRQTILIGRPQDDLLKITAVASNRAAEEPC
jgi:hypothetical protein